MLTNVFLVNAFGNLNGFELMFALGGMILIGHLIGKLFNKIKMPEVTGYIVSGILINLIIRFIFKKEAIVNELVDSFQVVIVIALSFVSFMIGTQISKYKVRKFSKTVIPVVILQLIFVVSFTTLFFWILNDLKFALLIGAISSATAPAAIVEITGKYKTKGALTDVLSSIVALDNLVGIIYFFTILGFIEQGNTLNVSYLPSFEYLIGAFAAIIIGIVTGFILVLFDKYMFVKIKDNDEKQHSYLVIMVGMILLISLGSYMISNSPLTSIYHVSPFITTLVAGIVFTNFIDQASNEEQSYAMHQFLPPLLTAFFVVAGMELDVTKLFTITGLYALVYVITHATGKFLGAYLGTRIVPSTKKVLKNHLPYAVLTQGGFEIYLAGIAATVLKDNQILLVVLTSVLMFELFAPLLLTRALFNAGEVKALSIPIQMEEISKKTKLTKTKRLRKNS
ncbi:cation:proton antiporter [Haploplasma axanthum]|uniref:NhaP-type Na+/H+ and K+/H+ antiporters n=1 Tax=Haploplasma axanthum TaxID=29552 RepID=A0A449BDH3_HAPAX|nr:cation:proton antiporter [Haploplasma axanthum]VEU80478.1 NhaP-type Na+/H+ and K+/H+ antiporters [Haploplasma axanthum]